MINRTRSFNKPKSMGSRTQVEELALHRKGHVLGITGKALDAYEAQMLI